MTCQWHKHYEARSKFTYVERLPRSLGFSGNEAKHLFLRARRIASDLCAHVLAYMQVVTHAGMTYGNNVSSGSISTQCRHDESCLRMSYTMRVHLRLHADVFLYKLTVEPSATAATAIVAVASIASASVVV